jgi:hypothetical protein
MIPDDWDGKFLSNPGAELASIDMFQQSQGLDLPPDYVDFLLSTDGGEGFIGWEGFEGKYFQLWKIDELPDVNIAYHAKEYLPGFLLIGSNGGGDAYAFDMKSGSNEIHRVPFIGMEEEYAHGLGISFSDLLTALRKS